MTPIKGTKGETIYIVSRWFMSFALPDKASAQACINFLDGKKGLYAPTKE